MKKEAIAAFVRAMSTQVWCVDPVYLSGLMALLDDMDETHAAALAREAVEMIEARVHPATVRAVATRSGAAAIIPVVGLLSPSKSSFFEEIFGIKKTQPLAVAAAVTAAASDSEVKVVVLAVDCPGGNALSVPEAADAIMAARGKKPIVAVITGICASGGYWLSASADEIIATPVSAVGSLGAFQQHDCYEKMNEIIGIKETYITSTPDKVEGMGHIPLTPEALAHRQGVVDQVDSLFMTSLAAARGRDMRQDGRGRTYIGQAAVGRGLIDRVGTMDEVLAAYNARPAPSSGSSVASRGRTLALMDSVDRARNRPI